MQKEAGCRSFLRSQHSGSKMQRARKKKQRAVEKCGKELEFFPFWIEEMWPNMNVCRCVMSVKMAFCCKSQETFPLSLYFFFWLALLLLFSVVFGGSKSLHNTCAHWTAQFFTLVTAVKYLNFRNLFNKYRVSNTFLCAMLVDGMAGDVWCCRCGCALLFSQAES